MRRQQTQDMARGFTIIELIVAISILGVMLFLINRLFFDTTNAVGLGAAMSQVIGNERGMQHQIAQDFGAMIGPWGLQGAELSSAPAARKMADGGGFLVIVNALQPTGTFPLPNGRTEARPVRDDTITFVRARRAAGLPYDAMDPASVPQPICPVSDGNYTSFPAKDLDCDYMLVNYGHGLIPTASGKDDDLGVPPSDSGNPHNELAHHWVLCRQATFLLKTQPKTLDSTFSDDISRYNCVVGQPIANSSPARPLAGAKPTGQLYQGLTDLAYCGLDAMPTEYAGAGEPDLNNYVIIRPDNKNHPNQLSAGQTVAQYCTEALKYSVYGGWRLRYSLPPTNGFDASQISATQVAIQHGYFAPGVSDFIVEFALDLKSPGLVDTDGNITSQNFGGIRWYCADASLANEPGTAGYDPTQPASYALPLALPSSITENDKIIAIGNGYQFPPSAVDQSYGSPKVPQFALVWRHDDDTAARLPSAGGVTDNTTNRTAWPMLLRLRWRLHDTRAYVTGPRTGGYGVKSGVWFEQIVRVPRPQ